MTGITRRTLIGHGAALAGVAGTTLVPAAASAAADAPARQPALFVFDARFARSAALAAQHRQAGAALLDPRESDLGIAWRGTIPALLQQGQAVAGLTPWSDRLICEIFAREAGVPFHAVAIPARTGAAEQLYQWTLG